MEDLVVQENNYVVLVTTKRCYACHVMKSLIHKAYTTHKSFKCLIYDIKDVPEWISINVKFNDFPTTIFIQNNVIKRVEEGTFNLETLIKYLKEIDL